MINGWRIALDLVDQHRKWLTFILYEKSCSGVCVIGDRYSDIYVPVARQLVTVNGFADS